MDGELIVPSFGTLVLFLGGWQGYDDGGYAKLQAWIGLGV
jgi:hypothetical protein